MVLACAKIRQRHQPGGFARGMGARVVRILLRGRGLLHPLHYGLRELAIVRGDSLTAIVPCFDLLETLPLRRAHRLRGQQSREQNRQRHNRTTITHD